MKNKALVIFYPDCIEFEAILAAQALHEENLEVDVATPDGKDYLGPCGIALRATHSFSEINPSDYRAVIVPGGDTSSVLMDESLIKILQAAEASGAALGAICAGPLLLARAGLLRGRRFTHGYSVDSPFSDWEQGTYTDELVVVDSNIVTAKPQAYIDFAVEVLYAAGLRDSWVVDRLEKSENYIRGDRAAEIKAVKAHYHAVWGGK